MSLEFDEIYRELSLPDDAEATEEDLFDHITARVSYFLEVDKSLLLSYMYRLDVEEKDIVQALEAQEDKTLAETLAALILERQKKRVETKKKYGSPPPIEGWEY